MLQPSGGRAGRPIILYAIRFRALLHIAICLWLLGSIGQLFSWQSFKAPRQCDCEHGVASSTICSGSGRAACNQCDAGYTLAASTKGGDGDDDPHEVVAGCRENTCSCIGGTPLTGVGCQMNELFKCSTCEPGFALSHGMVCKPVVATENEPAAVKFDSRPAGNDAGSTRLSLAALADQKLNFRVRDLDKQIQVLERTVDKNSRETAELRKFAWNSAGSTRQSFADLDKQIQALERTVDKNSRETAELRKFAWNSAGIIGSMPLVRKEDGNDQDCADVVGEAFDRTSGRLDLLKVDISEESLAEYAGACVGHSLQVKELEVSFENYPHFPGTVAEACIEQFFGGFGKNNEIEVLRLSYVFAGSKLCQIFSALVPGLHAVVIGSDAFANDDIEAKFLTSLVTKTTLKVFSSEDHPIGLKNQAVIATVLASNPQLENLTLSAAKLTLAALDKTFPTMESLKFLDISGNNFRFIGDVRLLDHIFSRLPRLSTLNLARNHVNLEMIDVVASVLESLESLDLSGNALRLADRSVANLFSKRPRLSMINLGENLLRAEKVCNMFCPNSPMLALSRLLLPNNFITDIDGLGATLANKMPALAELDLSVNKIAGRSVLEFLGALPANSRLKILELSGNCIPPEMADKITETAKRLPMLQISGLGVQYISSFKCQEFSRIDMYTCCH